MIEKITYNDKRNIVPIIDAEGQVSAEDLNMIKSVVNNWIDRFVALRDSVADDDNRLTEGIEIDGTVYFYTEEVLKAFLKQMRKLSQLASNKGLQNGQPFAVSAGTSFHYEVPAGAFLYALQLGNTSTIHIGSSNNGDEYGELSGNAGSVIEFGFLNAPEVYISSDVSQEITPILYAEGNLSLGGNIGGGAGTWEDLEGKPDVFPPALHSHSWDGISGKPTHYPPSKHKHSYNDLEDKPDFSQQIVIAGKVGYNPRRVIKRFKGDFNVYALNRSGLNPISDIMLEGIGQQAPEYCHKIVHNLGHTDYVVTGSAVNSSGSIGTVKFNCFYQSDNYCYVATADDSSGNVSDFVFQITSFK